VEKTAISPGSVLQVLDEAEAEVHTHTLSQCFFAMTKFGLNSLV